MKAHTLLGAQMISGVAFLHEAGVQVVRSHHERWDGRAIRTGSRGRRSRSARGSSRSRTPSTRSRTTGRTGRPAAGATAAARSSRSGERSSTRRSSTPSATASTRCTRSAGSSWPPRKLPRRGLRPDRGPAGDPGARARGRAGRDRAERRRLGPRAPLPDRALREARRAGADGCLRAGRARRRGSRLPLLHPRARGALARGRRRRRHGRGAHERLHAADSRVRHRGAAGALRAAARARRDDRRLRAHRAGGGLRRGLDPDARGRGRRRLDDHGREAVDHERQLRGHVPHLRPQRARDRGRARRLRLPARRRARAT